MKVKKMSLVIKWTSSSSFVDKVFKKQNKEREKRKKKRKDFSSCGHDSVQVLHKKCAY